MVTPETLQNLESSRPPPLPPFELERGTDEAGRPLREALRAIREALEARAAFEEGLLEALLADAEARGGQERGGSVPAVAGDGQILVHRGPGVITLAFAPPLPEPVLYKQGLVGTVENQMWRWDNTAKEPVTIAAPTADFQVLQRKADDSIGWDYPRVHA